MNLYKILGVKKDSTAAKIKAAFRARAKDLHPDKGGSDEDFAKLSAAYMVLRDKERREKYDETGEVDQSGVDQDLRNIASMLMSLFDVAIKEKLHEQKDVDVIKLMRHFVEKVVGEKTKKVATINNELVAITSLAKRISSKDKRNLLGSLIDKKKEVLFHSRTTLGQDLRLAQMLSEELENYTCLVEVARTVEMYFVGEVMTTDASTSW